MEMKHPGKTSFMIRDILSQTTTKQKQEPLQCPDHLPLDTQYTEGRACSPPDSNTDSKSDQADCQDQDTDESNAESSQNSTGEGKLDAMISPRAYKKERACQNLERIFVKRC